MARDLANAAEANPIMAPFLERGPAVFIQAKLALLIVPLIVVELARRKNPTFVRRAVNVAIVAYVGLYAAGVSHVNGRASKEPLFLPYNTQAQLDARRAQMGLPPGPPLRMVERAAEQRRIRAAAVERNAKSIARRNPVSAEESGASIETSGPPPVANATSVLKVLPSVL